MRKIIFALAALLTFTACSKDKIAQQTITIRAGIEKSSTRLRSSSHDASMALFADEDGAIKEKFTTGDRLMLFDASGNMTEFSVSAVDETTGVATFTGTPSVAIPEGAAVSAVLKNSAVSDYDAANNKITASLHSQAGTLADAGAHELLYARGTFEGGMSNSCSSISHPLSVSN